MHGYIKCLFIRCFQSPNQTKYYPNAFRVIPVHAPPSFNYWEGWEWGAASYEPLENSCYFSAEFLGCDKQVQHLWASLYNVLHNLFVWGTVLNFSTMVCRLSFLHKFNCIHNANLKNRFIGKGLLLQRIPFKFKQVLSTYLTYLVQDSLSKLNFLF